MIRLHLADVPLDVRMKAAQKVCKTAPPQTRAEIIAAALMPTEKHWLHDSARPMLEQWAAERRAA